jgi:cutinase
MEKQGITVGPVLVAAMQLAIPDIWIQGVGGPYTADLLANFLPEGTNAASINEAKRLFQMSHAKCPDTPVVTAGYRLVPSDNTYNITILNVTLIVRVRLSLAMPYLNWMAPLRSKLSALHSLAIPKISSWEAVSQTSLSIEPEYFAYLLTLSAMAPCLFFQPIFSTVWMLPSQLLSSFLGKSRSLDESLWVMLTSPACLTCADILELMFMR